VFFIISPKLDKVVKNLILYKKTPILALFG